MGKQVDFVFKILGRELATAFTDCKPNVKFSQLVDTLEQNTAVCESMLGIVSTAKPASITRKTTDQERQPPLDSHAVTLGCKILNVSGLFNAIGHGVALDENILRLSILYVVYKQQFDLDDLSELRASINYVITSPEQLKSPDPLFSLIAITLGKSLVVYRHSSKRVDVSFNEYSSLQSENNAFIWIEEYENADSVTYSAIVFPKKYGNNCENLPADLCFRTTPVSIFGRASLCKSGDAINLEGQTSITGKSPLRKSPRLAAQSSCATTVKRSHSSSFRQKDDAVATSVAASSSTAVQTFKRKKTTISTRRSSRIAARIMSSDKRKNFKINSTLASLCGSVQSGKLARTPNQTVFKCGETDINGEKGSCNCLMVFKTLGHLKRHLNPEKRYKCTICKRMFKELSDLRRHKNGFHSRIGIYNCPYCGEIFKWRTGLVAHSRIAHPDQPRPPPKKADRKPKKVAVTKGKK